ncbi:hypothetical protein Hanom_Chr01g00000491 [Helianthus anomalus]
MEDQKLDGINLSIEEWPLLQVQVKSKRTRSFENQSKPVNSVEKQEYEEVNLVEECGIKESAKGRDTVVRVESEPVMTGLGYGRGRGRGEHEHVVMSLGGKGFGRAHVIRERQLHGMDHHYVVRDVIHHHHVVPGVTDWTDIVDRAVKKTR